MAQPILICLTKKVSVNDIPINGEKFSIGRGLHNECVIEDFRVSRTHCAIERINGEWNIVDKSANGTSLNGRPIDKINSHKLNNNDIITVCEDAKFQFKIPTNCKRKILSDTDILNIADSVISDVEAFQAEFGDENFDQSIFNEEIPSVNKIPRIDSNVDGEPVTNQDLPDKTDPSVSTKLCASSSSAVEKLQAANLECVENELQCSICAELFVHAVTLSCSHSYCKFCLDQWRKNQSLCPICRSKITDQVHTRVIDNFIEKFLETASDEVKEHRKEVIMQREAAVAGPSSSAVPVRTGSVAIAPSGTSATAGTSAIEISSEDDTTDNDSYDSMSEYMGSDWEGEYGEDDDWYEGYNGVPGNYYGGYGQCYACGQSGHWANGCPNRRRRY